MFNYDDLIGGYKQEFLNDLNELIAIPSVSAEGAEVPASALEWMLKKAEIFGLKTKNIDNIVSIVVTSFDSLMSLDASKFEVYVFPSIATNSEGSKSYSYKDGKEPL